MVLVLLMIIMFFLSPGNKTVSVGLRTRVPLKIAKIQKFHKFQFSSLNSYIYSALVIISGKVTYLMVPVRCHHRFLLVFRRQKLNFLSYRCPFLDDGKKLNLFWNSCTELPVQGIPNLSIFWCSYHLTRPRKIAFLVIY